MGLNPMFLIPGQSPKGVIFPFRFLSHEINSITYDEWCQ